MGSVAKPLNNTYIVRMVPAHEMDKEEQKRMMSIMYGYGPFGWSKFCRDFVESIEKEEAETNETGVTSDLID